MLHFSSKKKKTDILGSNLMITNEGMRWYRGGLLLFIYAELLLKVNALILWSWHVWQVWWRFN